MYRFNKKTYLITGANSGIGKALSEELIKWEANLFMVDINLEHFHGMIGNGKPVGGGVFDLSKPETIPSIFQKAKSEGFIFDGMVYCAGISPLMSLKDFDLNMMRNVYNINMVSFLAMLRFFMDEGFTNSHSSVVGISSSTSIYGGNRQYAYGSSKAAMNSIIKNCSVELGERNTRLNAIMPSITNTEMVSKLRQQSDAIDANVKYKMPFGILEPRDIIKGILYLLSDECKLTGVTMPVNNGEIY